MNLSMVRKPIAWCLAIIAAVLILLIYYKLSQPEGGRFYDFRTGYYAAGQAVLLHGSAALWPLIEDHWFVNFPIIAWICAPYAFFDPPVANWLYTLVGLVASATAFLLIAFECTKRVKLLILLLFVLNGPLWYSLMIGNSTQFILLFLVSALVLWKRRWMYCAGILIGVAAVIKPLLGLLGVYFVWRRNWRIVVGAATAIGAALASTLVIFGLQFTLGWYHQVVETFAGRPMGAHNVQSLAGFLLRLQAGPDFLFNWQPQNLAFPFQLVRSLVTGGLLLLTALAMWLNRRKPDGLAAPDSWGLDLLEFSLVLAFCITLSTVSWTHYYLLLLIPWSFYVSGQLPLRNDRLTRIMLWTSVVLCSLPCAYPRINQGLLAQLSSRTVQSVWLFGGLLLLCLLLRSALVRSDQKAWP